MPADKDKDVVCWGGGVHSAVLTSEPLKPRWAKRGLKMWDGLKGA